MKHSKNTLKKLWLIALLTLALTTLLCLAVGAETYSGTCGTEGDNLTWSLDTETGILQITGTGSMSKNGSDNAPWYSYRESIQTVVINNGATNICASAFANCTGLTNVFIPDSVTSLGNLAFSGCSSLTELRLPATLTWIGSSVLSGCTALADLYFPSTEAEWNSIAKATNWDDGSSEHTVHFGAHWGSFGNNLFWFLDIENGVLKIMCKGATGTMPDYSNYSGAPWSSYRTNITSVAIGEGVTNIGEYAFSECSNLTSVTIPEGVTNISSSAFLNCSSLTSISIPNSLTSIGSGAFEGCSSLTYNTHSNAKYLGNTENPYVVLISATSEDIAACNIHSDTKVIFAGAFSSCSGLLSITIPASVTSIGSGAFSMCTELERVIFEGSSKLTSVGANAFEGCHSITGVYISDLAAWCKIDFECGAEFGEEWLWYETNPLTIAKNLYLNNEPVTDLVIPDGVTHIGSGAFDGGDFTSITVPKSVMSIGEGAFYDCTSLTSITLSTSVTSIGEGAFYDCTSLTSITLPTSVTSIGKYAFSGCNGLTSITLPFVENFKELFSRQRVSIRGSDYYYIYFVPKTVVITGGASIGDYEFSNCTTLTSITLPTSVTSIGYRAFSGCTSLTSIALPASVTSIGDAVFYNCDSLVSVSLAEGNAFYHITGNCLIETASKTLVAGWNAGVIPDDGSVTSIADMAMCGVNAGIVIPKSVTNIGARVFEDTHIREIYYGGSEAEWDNIKKDNEWNCDDDDEYGYGLLYRSFEMHYNYEPVDFISYQVTKGENGTFSLRAIAGLNSLNYKNFGYEVTITTKDEDGNDVVTTLSGTDDKAYSSIFGGTTEYSIKEHFGYEYAGLATITNLAIDSSYTKIEIRTFVTTMGGEVKYGKSGTLLYTGALDENDYPRLETVTE